MAAFAPLRDPAAAAVVARLDALDNDLVEVRNDLRLAVVDITATDQDVCRIGDTVTDMRLSHLAFAALMGSEIGAVQASIYLLGIAWLVLAAAVIYLLVTR